MNTAGDISIDLPVPAYPRSPRRILSVPMVAIGVVPGARTPRFLPSGRRVEQTPRVDG